MNSGAAKSTENEAIVAIGLTKWFAGVLIFTIWQLNF
jgi:hypothetical protein